MSQVARYNCNDCNMPLVPNLCSCKNVSDAHIYRKGGIRMNKLIVDLVSKADKKGETFCLHQLKDEIPRTAFNIFKAKKLGLIQETAFIHNCPSINRKHNFYLLTEKGKALISGKTITIRKKRRHRRKGTVKYKPRYISTPALDKQFIDLKVKMLEIENAMLRKMLRDNWTE